MVRIVITGDNHLNLYNQKLGSKLAERRRRIGQAWYETVDYAVKNKADIYINTGDLFDQLSPRNPPRARVVEAFKRLKDNGIEAYIAAGNHEAPASEREGASPHCILSEAGLANVFESYTEFQQFKKKVGVVEVSIAGMSFNRNLAPKDDPLEGKYIPAGSDLNIAVLHYSVEEIAPPIWEEPVVKIDSLKRNLQIHIFAMGHIHGHVSTRINYSHLVYPGGTEHYDFGEWEQQTGFVVIDYKNGDIQIKYVPVESQPMKQLKLHTSHMEHEQMTDSIVEAVSIASNKDGLLQLVLEGEIPFRKYTDIDFNEINQLGTAQNFYFELIDRIKPTGEGLQFKISEGLNPRKRLEEIAMEAVENSVGEDQKIWQQAMTYALDYYIKERAK